MGTRGYVRNRQAIAKDAVMTKEGCVAHIAVPWLHNLDTLPVNGAKWVFGCCRWSNGGGQTIGGVVHEIGCGLLIDFGADAQRTLALKRTGLKMAYNTFAVWRDDFIEGFGKYADSDLGDPAFAAKSLQPMVDEFTAAGKRIDALKDDELDAFCEKYMFCWANVVYEAQLKRAQWIDDRLFEE